MKKHLFLAFVSSLFLITLFVFETKAQKIENTAWEQVVPSQNIPSNLKLRKSNNNLDVIQFGGKYFLAFRNAPNHFASRKARMIILSSTDMENWTLDKIIHVNNDMREPRFAEINNKLFLYFFEAGHVFYKFQPQHVHYCVYSGDSTWTDPTLIPNLDNFIIWRIRKWGNTLYMSASNGEYKDGEKIGEQLWIYQSTDGIHWEPITKEPQLRHPRSVCEGEFLFDQQGNIWGVARLEVDGSYTFKIDKDSIKHKWNPHYSSYKYDSSLMFENDGDFYLIARRNLDGDGSFVRKEEKYKKNRIRYSLTKKKTALFKLDTNTMEWVHIKDFASTGDTAFPGIVKTSDSEYVVFNYSSNIHKKDKNWIFGQLGKTYIYKTTLKISDKE